MFGGGGLFVHGHHMKKGENNEAIDTVDKILIHSSWIHQAIFFITVSNNVSSARVKMFEMLAILVGYITKSRSVRRRTEAGPRWRTGRPKQLSREQSRRRRHAVA